MVSEIFLFLVLSAIRYLVHVCVKVCVLIRRCVGQKTKNFSLSFFLDCSQDT